MNFKFFANDFLYEFSKYVKKNDRSEYFQRVVLQLKDLRVGQQEEPCIMLIQENSIEKSIQDCLPYI